MIKHQTLWFTDFNETTLEKLDNEIKLDWDMIFLTQKLSESFIEKHVHKSTWWHVLMGQTLSEPFIEKHWNDFSQNDKWKIPIKQKLSETFIEKYWNELAPYWVFSKQKLSETFIEKYMNNLNLDVSELQNVSDEFLKKHKMKKIIHKKIFNLKYGNRSMVIYQDDLNKVFMGSDVITLDDIVNKICKSSEKDEMINAYLELTT